MTELFSLVNFIKLAANFCSLDYDFMIKILTQNDGVFFSCNDEYFCKFHKTSFEFLKSMISWWKILTQNDGYFF